MKTSLLSTLAVLCFLAPPALADTFEPNDTLEQAFGPLGSGIAYESFISSVSDFDWYSIDANLGPITVSLTSIPLGTDYDLFITNDLGEELLSSENSDNQDELISANVTGAGRFYIVILPFNGFHPEDSYILTATFTPLVTNTAPMVTLTSPNGGETLTGGGMHTITYSATDAEGNAGLTIDLEFSTNGGSTFSPIATGTSNTGSFSWSVPNVSTSMGRVRVTARDAGGLTAQDASNANFTIQPAAPLGIATLAVGTGLNVTAGQAVSVPVNLTHDQPLAGLQLTVTFDQARLTPQSVTAAARAQAMTLSSNLTRPGEVILTLHSDAGLTVAAGSGPIVNISFLAAVTANGTVNLVVSNAVVSDSQARAMNLTTMNGSVTITGGVTPDLDLTIPQSVTGPPGTLVDVPVTFSANLPVAALQFGLTYNPAVLTATLVTQGSRTAGMTMETNTGLSGEARVVFYFPGGGTLAAGSGTAATIRFQVAASPPDNSSLTFIDVVASDALGTALPVTAQAGMVTGVHSVSIAASRIEGGVRLTWTAEADEGHAGYRVLRDGGDGAVPAHDGLLPAAARDFTDLSVPSPGTFMYWLEAVDRSGGVQRFGPAVIDVVPLPLRVGFPFPNPMRTRVSVDVESNGPADVAVLDAAGRVVRRFQVPGGTGGQVTWNGKRDDGLEAAAGIYFLRFQSAGLMALRRVVKEGR